MWTLIDTMKNRSTSCSSADGRSIFLASALAQTRSRLGCKTRFDERLILTDQKLQVTLADRSNKYEVGVLRSSLGTTSELIDKVQIQQYLLETKHLCRIRWTHETSKNINTYPSAKIWLDSIWEMYSVVGQARQTKLSVAICCDLF